LTVPEFLSIIRGDPLPEATTAFVAAIHAGGRARPDEPISDHTRPAQQVSREDWLKAVLYGIHGPTHPDYAGGLREYHFNPDEPWDERGRWTADGSGNRDHFAVDDIPGSSPKSPFKLVSDPNPSRRELDRHQISSDDLTWKNYQGKAPPPEERRLPDGGEAEAMTYSNFHISGGKTKTTTAKRAEGPPATPGKDQGGRHYVAKSTAADAAYHATIDQKSSWASDSARNNPAALEHERRHVRISEIAAAMATRRARAAVGVGAGNAPGAAETNARRDLLSKLSKIVDDTREWQEKAQDDYDKKQGTVRSRTSSREWRRRSMRGSPMSVVNSRACAAGVLAAGMLLLALGCASKPDAGNRGNSSPPTRPAADHTPPGGPGGAAEKRDVPNVAASLTVSFDKRPLAGGSEVELARGSEISVREEMCWNHAPSVNRYLRLWRVKPLFTGNQRPASGSRLARTASGEVVIGRDAASWEELEDYRDLIEPAQSSASGDVREYRLRFVDAGSYKVNIVWCVGIAEGNDGKFIGFGDRTDVIVNVVDGARKLQTDTGHERDARGAPRTAAPPVPTDHGRPRPDEHGAKAPGRTPPNDSVTLVLEAQGRKPASGDEVAVAPGDEIEVCERLSWRRLDIVDHYSRSWYVWRGSGDSAIKIRNVRTDAGTVVIGGDANLWEDNENCTDGRIFPISRGANGELEHTRRYRLRFVEAGWYKVQVTWTAGTPKPGNIAFEDYEGVEDFIVRVADAPQKPGMPAGPAAPPTRGRVPL
jgi:hypothetical protein